MKRPFHKFDCFVEDLGRKVHDLNADVLKVMLSDTAPVAGNARLGDLVEIPAGLGYPAGGLPSLATQFAQAGGIATLTGTDVVFAGSFGPFRYAVIYNSTAPGGPLIGWWDYGRSITLNSSFAFGVGLGEDGILSVE